MIPTSLMINTPSAETWSALACAAAPLTAVALLLWALGRWELWSLWAQAGAAIALFVLTLLGVGKVFELGEQVWPTSLTWPTILLVAGLLAGLLGYLVARWSFGEASMSQELDVQLPIALVIVAFTAAAGCVLGAVDQYVQAVERAIAPLSIGGLVLLVVIFAGYALSDRRA